MILFLQYHRVLAVLLEMGLLMLTICKNVLVLLRERAIEELGKVQFALLNARRVSPLVVSSGFEATLNRLANIDIFSLHLVAIAKRLLNELF